MSATVSLTVEDGDMRGRHTEFTARDWLLFGRDPTCDVVLAEDAAVSRRHCVLEINPPEACLHDLGSRNGTYVNGVRYGGVGTADDESPGRPGDAGILLRAGDTMRLGQSVIRIGIKVVQTCRRCGSEFSASRAGKSLCKRCLGRSASRHRRAHVCSSCGQPVDVGDAAGSAGEQLLCPACEQALALGPDEVAAEIVEGLHDAAIDPASSLRRLELVRKLGTGRLGEVFLVRCRESAEQAVLKLVPTRRSTEEHRWRHVLHEVDALRTLRHPNIVGVWAAGARDEVVFLLTEYCDGGALSELLREHGRLGLGLPLADAAPIMIDALAGVAHAHRSGVVHCDIKPSNILLCSGAERHAAKIADFGLVPHVEHAGLKGITTATVRGGVPVFMAPEQIVHCHERRPTVDVYGLGACFYYLLTGCQVRDFELGLHPFATVLKTQPVPIEDRGQPLPAEVSAVINRAVADSPTERYADACAFLRALERSLSQAL